MSNTGYSSNQFFGIGSAETFVNNLGQSVNYATKSPDNPPFIYPSREIITQASDGSVTRTTMQRGYIRTLVSSANGVNIGVRKCAFQFNPQFLTTSVQMTQDVLNAYQIDPGQFSVPTAANSNFSVSLFFDRSMELNSPGVFGYNGDPNSANIFSGDGAADPSQIGVFRDIGELNAIIGAGLSAEELQFAQNTAASQIYAEAVSNGLGTFNSSGVYVPGTSDTTVQTAINNVPTTLGPVNYGNTAFLIPQPVRAVFSSLFMVEGFVTNVDITYTKFTTQMVPMQATVVLTMNAQYIGYAKQKTYVTASLDAQATAYTDGQNSIQDSLNSLATALQASAGVVNVFVPWTDPHSTLSNLATIIPVLSGTPGLGGVLVTASQAVSGVSNDFAAFHSIPGALSARDAESSADFLKVGFAGSLVQGEPVNTILTDPSNPTITMSHSVTVTVSGPVDPLFGPTSTALPILWQVTDSQNDPTWTDLATGSIYPSTSVGPNIYPSTLFDGSKTFVLNAVVSISVLYNGQQINGLGTATTTTSNLGTQLSFHVPMLWLGNIVQGTTVANTVASNSAAASKTPGSTSLVGARVS